VRESLLLASFHRHCRTRLALLTNHPPGSGYAVLRLFLPGFLVNSLRESVPSIYEISRPVPRPARLHVQNPNPFPPLRRHPRPRVSAGRRSEAINWQVGPAAKTSARAMRPVVRDAITARRRVVGAVLVGSVWLALAAGVLRTHRFIPLCPGSATFATLADRLATSQFPCLLRICHVSRCVSFCIILSE
jgi:hypothetical protein